MSSASSFSPGDDGILLSNLSKEDEKRYAEADKGIKNAVEIKDEGRVPPDTYASVVERAKSASAQREFDSMITEMKNLFMATLYMFKTRGEGYDYKGLLRSAQEQRTTADFFNAIMSVNFHNPVRNIIHELYGMNKKRPTNIKKVFVKLSMSFLICNPSGKFTCVFFIPKGSEQTSGTIPINIIRDVAYTLSRLISIDVHIPINEVILINSGKLSSEATSHFTALSNNNVFVQLFNEMDILVPSVSSVFTSKIERLITKPEEIDKFVEENRIFDVRKLRTVNHQKDPVMKYLGIRPETLIKFVRPEIIPEDITRDSTHVRCV